MQQGVKGKWEELRAVLDLNGTGVSYLLQISETSEFKSVHLISLLT